MIIFTEEQKPFPTLWKQIIELKTNEAVRKAVANSCSDELQAFADRVNLNNPYILPTLLAVQ